MCGFVGIVNYDKNLINSSKIIENMAKKIARRGPDENGYFIKEKILLWHNRLIVRDPVGGTQPMTIVHRRHIIHNCL